MCNSAMMMGVGTMAAAYFTGGASLGMSAALGGGVMAVTSQYQAGQFQKQIGEVSAQNAETKANDTLQQGAVAMRQNDDITQQRIGAQRALEGASGAQTDTGSFGNVTAQTAASGERDTQTIRMNALKQAWGMQTEAVQEGAGAQLAGQVGTNQAMGSLLTTGMNAYGMGTGYGKHDFRWS